MSARNTKSNRQPIDESADPLGWIALIVAALLALVMVIQTTPSVRGGDDPQTAAASD